MKHNMRKKCLQSKAVNFKLEKIQSIIINKMLLKMMLKLNHYTLKATELKFIKQNCNAVKSIPLGFLNHTAYTYFLFRYTF